MQLDWRASERIGAPVSPALFGANMLFDRDRLGPDGTYDDVVRNLGVGHVRYPGGSVTEWYFDIADPDARRVWDPDRQAFRDLTPLSEVLDWAGSAGLGVTLVVPTASLTETGADGQRHPRASAFREVRDYVADVLAGRYGAATIDAFEIGNEYWHSAKLDDRAYLEIADVAARAIQAAIDAHRSNGGVAPNWTEPKVAVQVGQYGESSTDPGHVQNDRLIAGLSDAAAAAIDAVVVHYYTRGTFADLPGHGYYFDRLDSWAADPRFAGIDYAVTEWSTDNWLTEEYGLRQASTMVWMLSEMVARGVDSAHVWPLQQRTDNDLSGDEGQAGLTVPGEAMRMMAERLPGLTLDRRLDFDGGVAWLYRGADRAVVMVSSRSLGAQTVEIDAAALGLSGWRWGTVTLGSDGGVGDPNAPPVLDIVADAGRADGTLTLALGPFETGQILLSAGSGAPPVDGPMRGSVHDDSVAGSDGADSIDGRGGDDRLDGRGGDDRILGGDGDDRVQGGPGADLVDLGPGDDRFEDDPEAGAAGADKVFGGEGNDVLNGRGGPDSLSGDAGNDTLRGGDGNDTGLGEDGNDLIEGQDGDDDLDGGTGNDRIFGQNGDDTLDGGSGEDRLSGGPGADVLRGGAGDDSLTGDDDNDVLAGEDGDDSLSGGRGDDTLAAGNGSDTLSGGAGADVFVFDRDDGFNRIDDFDAGDVIDLRGQGIGPDGVQITETAEGIQLDFAGTTVLLSGLLDHPPDTGFEFG